MGDDWRTWFLKKPHKATSPGTACGNAPWSYLFVSQIETKTVEQIQEWIEHGEGEGP